MADHPLEAALRAHLHGWRTDLSAGWRSMLAGVEPAFSDVREDLLLRDGETIFPARKGQVIPGAPADAHVFRALDRVAPNAVKAIVIGQDPYPRISRATGRAFDQGDVGSSRVDLQACKLEYSIVSPK